MPTPPTTARERLRKARAKQLTTKQVIELLEAGRIYYPPYTGLHVCGSDDVHNAAVTVASFPMDEALARAAYDHMLAEFEDANADDVVVDLFVCGDLIDNFSMRRQMVDRLTRECSQ